eukprot:59214_1
MASISIKSKTTINIVLSLVILSVLLNIILNLSADEMFIYGEPQLPNESSLNQSLYQPALPTITPKPTLKPTNLQHNVPSNTLLPFSHIPKQNELSLPTIRSHEIHRSFNPHKCGFDGKVFVLGASKTCTTTMSDILSTFLGYPCTRHPMNTCAYYGLQPYYLKASLPLYVAPDDISWLFHSQLLYNDFIESLKKSRSFSDSPWTYLYPLYDQLIPANHSKFILLVRDSTRDVVNSNMKMMARRDAPVQFDYTNHTQHPKGMRHTRWKTFWMITARQYELHNKNVIQYFTKKDRLNDLLIMNVAMESRKKRSSERWYKLTKFLQCDIMLQADHFLTRIRLIVDKWISFQTIIQLIGRILNSHKR